MEKNFSILKNVGFSGKGRRQSLHNNIIINVMRIRKMLISCVKLDYALTTVHLGRPFSLIDARGPKRRRLEWNRLLGSGNHLAMGNIDSRISPFRILQVTICIS